MQILGIILVALIIIIGLIYLSWKRIGDADIKFYLEKHTPFVLAEAEKSRVIFTTTFEVANIGKQCATIMDCFVRSQLPYEQFDKVEVRGKAQLAGVPRDDDYFEAVLIQKHEKIEIVIKIELTDRNAGDIKKTLEHTVDIPVDVVYQHTARHEASLSKKRLVLPAKEIASLLNIELIN
ncbi:hypothetical protein [Pectinatus cerevisiiphilus]|uniref:Uncharacterized protein n=1 Tax=Pectinatus cerevisiiphilus TaxID=86956 RepID=A0A4R3KAN4_9FIRM|nr:hypothetical protein [Pectinatus cerevisiiphilus]TCS79711.1 hypothetical protein EDC37_106127 [Pectinatus cerevisiiphilus]